MVYSRGELFNGHFDMLWEKKQDLKNLLLLLRRLLEQRRDP